MTKQGIIKSIRTGKISAIKNVHGEWEIDPAELFRVYEPTKSVDNQPSINEYPQVNAGIQGGVSAEIEVLRVQLAAEAEKAIALAAQLKKAETREAWLTTANEKLTAIVEQQTRLLEHVPDTSQKPLNPRGWLSRILGIGGR